MKYYIDETNIEFNVGDLVELPTWDGSHPTFGIITKIEEIMWEIRGQLNVYINGEHFYYKHYDILALYKRDTNGNFILSYENKDMKENWYMNYELKKETNMRKGLEALHHPRIELAKIDISVEGKHDIAYMPFYKTKQYTAIEKELKEYEMEHTLRIRLENANYELVREKQENERKLKALEIIRKFAKSINLKYIFCDDLVILIIGGDEFEWQYKCKTQEEYNLLREVLL